MRSTIGLGDPLLVRRVGVLVREARILTGCSQADLADRASTSQSRLSRIELGQVDEIELGLACRLLDAVGFRRCLVIDDLALEDRRAQRDTVHAWIVAVVARRLRAAGWWLRRSRSAESRHAGGSTSLLTGLRISAGLLSEVKGDLPDIGGMQRQVAFYDVPPRT